MDTRQAPGGAAAATRFQLIQYDLPEDGADDVVDGLTASAKTLPSRFFYDDRGSALFERICDLPEYYPTRTEEEILRRAAGEIVEITGPAEFIEFGSGSDRKIRLLLQAARARGHPLHYLPIDVSDGILTISARGLQRDFPGIKILGLAGTYEQALADMPQRTLPRRLGLFLGSTVGNLSDPECRSLLDRVHAGLEPGDYFLVGCDLQKPVEIIEAAYNDASGVTADFNRNILRHLNRRFDGNFEPHRFAHRAFYNRAEDRIEMHLESLADQRITLKRLDLAVSFREGETVRTEISRKFDLDTLTSLFGEHGFRVAETWRDPRGWFAVTLFQAV